MKRRHGFLLSAAIALIAVVGVFAATRTVGLGNGARSAADARVAARTAQLDRYAASLHTMLVRSARSLPAQPSGSQATAATGSSRAVRVVYHRPPPIVIHTHRAGEAEHGDAGGRDGGELDD